MNAQTPNFEHTPPSPPPERTAHGLLLLVTTGNIHQSVIPIIILYVEYQSLNIMTFHLLSPVPWPSEA